MRGQFERLVAIGRVNVISLYYSPLKIIIDLVVDTATTCDRRLIAVQQSARRNVGEASEHFDERSELISTAKLQLWTE